MEKKELTTTIEKEIKTLLELSEGYVEQEIGIHEIEKGLLQQLLVIGLSVLQYVIHQKLEKLKDYKFELSSGNSYRSTGKKARNYLSLFGSLKIERPSYWNKDLGRFYNLDEYLKLPRGSYWSYNIQKLVGKTGAENDYNESVKMMNELLGLGLSGKSSERNIGRLGEEVDSFYGGYEKEEKKAEEKVIVNFMAGFDGKGIPKIKPIIGEKGNPKERLKKGEKRGIKQMATVSVTSSFIPQQKTYKSIIRGLMGTDNVKKVEDQAKTKKDSKPQTDNRIHKNIHRRGFLANQEKAIDYGIKDIKERMTDPASRFVVPIDAGIGLEDKVLECIKKYGLEKQFDGIILDIVHVSEYVWDAATAILGEKSKLKRDWVKGVLEDILSNQTDKVISNLKQNLNKTNLSISKEKQLNKTITYFTNHKHKMNYHSFLEKGYPISSAIVESTCKHLVKDRMEQSGMRWSSKGAQNMLDIRAVKINDDMDEFMDFVIEQDRKVNLIRTAA